ncbi:MAG: C10 family peptidase [Muribaculaceae bacterium]|nr:C10 family peptidase [Muribaculaceae bacterium]
MKNFIFAVIALLMVACSQEQIILPEPEVISPETRSTHIPLSEALKVADRMIRAVEPEGTRASARTVESIEYYGGSATRSGEEEPMFYVVNYANDGGFAVLGADTRVDSIYAFSDEGHLDMNDTTFNEGLNIFFESLALENTYQQGNQMDTTIHQFQPIGEIITDVSYRHGPFLTPAVRKWHQSAPYNTFCPLIPVIHRENTLSSNFYIVMTPSIVGCANIAMGQIMSFYECPKVYGTHVFNWEEMKSWLPEQKTYFPVEYYPAPEHGVARLLREIGTEGNMKTEYGVNSSSTNTKKYYKRTFKTFEYKEPGDFKTFSTETLSSYIERNKPVLVRGNYDNGDGHVWVIDGLYCDRFRYTNNLGALSYSGQGTFFHVVWGWGGACNGYFKHGSGFTQHSEDFRDENDPSNWEDDWNDHVKIYKLEFCGDISPR